MTFKIGDTVKTKTRMCNPLDPYNNGIIVRKTLNKIYNYDKIMISLCSKNYNEFVGSSTKEGRLESSKILLTEKIIKSISFFRNA